MCVCMCVGLYETALGIFPFSSKTFHKTPPPSVRLPSLHNVLKKSDATMEETQKKNNEYIIEVCVIMGDYVFMYVAIYTPQSLGDKKLSYLLKINIKRENVWSKKISLHRHFINAPRWKFSSSLAALSGWRLAQDDLGMIMACERDSQPLRCQPPGLLLCTWSKS